MRRRKFITLIAGVVVGERSFTARAQQPKGMKRAAMIDPATKPPVISNVRTVSSINTLFNCLNNGTTTSNNLNAHGSTSAPDGSTVSVYNGATLLGTGTCSGGGWTVPLGILADAAYTITATVTVGGSTSPASSGFNFTVAPGLTSLPGGVGTNITNNGTFFWGGVKYKTLNDPNATSPCIIASTHQLDITLTPTDVWPGNNSNRSEISTTSFGDGTTFNVTYEFLLSASSPINDAFGRGKWFVIGQLGDPITPINLGGPPLEFNLGGDNGGTGPSPSGDNFCVDAALGGSLANRYRVNSNISRGVWHTIDLIAKPQQTSGALLEIWLDGAQIINSTSAPYFYGNRAYWWKVGLYRGGRKDQTQVARYRNLLVTMT
jgi:hypothetical protein